jgi:hypothetical protein
MAPPAGTFIVLQGHVVKLARLVRFQLDSPENSAGFDSYDRGNPRKVAGFATDPYVGVMGDFFIVPVVAGLTCGQIPPPMAEPGGLRMAGKTRLPAVRGGAICLQVDCRESKKSGVFVVPVAFEAKRGNLVRCVSASSYHRAMANHAPLIGGGQCG